MRPPIVLLCLTLAVQAQTSVLLHPESAEFTRPAPDRSLITFTTTKGDVVIEVTRAWAPRGADRFYNLARLGYYNDTRITRVVGNSWAQFGINGTPAIAKAWRAAEFANDPFIPANSNVRGTVAFAFKDQKALTTQVFINLRDNSPTHDKEPFVPFGRVIRGMEIVDAWNKEYGDRSGGGIRAGRQDPLFDGGNAYIDAQYPRLDSIKNVTVTTIAIANPRLPIRTVPIPHPDFARFPDSPIVLLPIRRLPMHIADCPLPHRPWDDFPLSL